ncbi:hypothetical protein M5K25_011010 [Dendrobium thyrsiflorum]|uniref:Uncharacterized protein n=1 Tax=Dendrobium thyrsiflorum TaxID=117978 RepID=A0ABD0V8Z5_DENTH
MDDCFDLKEKTYNLAFELRCLTMWGAADEFILDLVEQCSFQKQRVMHLLMTCQRGRGKQTTINRPKYPIGEGKGEDQKTTEQQLNSQRTSSSKGTKQPRLDSQNREKKGTVPAGRENRRTQKTGPQKGSTKSQEAPANQESRRGNPKGARKKTEQPHREPKQQEEHQEIKQQERKRETNNHKPPKIPNRRGEGRRPKDYRTAAKQPTDQQPKRHQATSAKQPKQGEKRHGSSREGESMNPGNRPPKRQHKIPRGASQPGIKAGKPKGCQEENRTATLGTEATRGTPRDKATSDHPKKLLLTEISKKKEEVEIRVGVSKKKFCSDSPAIKRSGAFRFVDTSGSEFKAAASRTLVEGSASRTLSFKPVEEGSLITKAPFFEPCNLTSFIDRRKTASISPSKELRRPSSFGGGTPVIAEYCNMYHNKQLPEAQRLHVRSFSSLVIVQLRCFAGSVETARVTSPALCCCPTPSLLNLRSSLLGIAERRQPIAANQIPWTLQSIIVSAGRLKPTVANMTPVMSFMIVNLGEGARVQFPQAVLNTVYAGATIQFGIISEVMQFHVPTIKGAAKKPTVEGVNEKAPKRASVFTRLPLAFAPASTVQK